MQAGIIENELKFRTIADFTADWEYWLDDTGRFRYVSSSCEKITGYGPGEFYENPRLLLSIIHPDDSEKVAMHKEEILDGRREGTIDFRIRRKDGAERWIGHRCRLVYNDKGAWLGIRGSNRDITDYKRMEGILHASEEKFSKAFRISPDAININRLSDGVYIDINEGFTRVTGYSSEDVLGRSSLPGDLNIWVREEDRQGLVDGLKEHGEVVGLEAPFRCKDGTIITGLMSAKIIDINSEQCILSITRDISDRKRHEEELARLNRLHNVLSHVNQALLRSHSQKDLFGEICRIIVEQGGFDWSGSDRMIAKRMRFVPWRGRENRKSLSGTSGCMPANCRWKRLPKALQSVKESPPSITISSLIRVHCHGGIFIYIRVRNSHP
jgi:PAS domain S-box-containing protein